MAELAALQISVSADAATQQVKQFGEAAGKMGTQAEAGAQKAVRAFKELAGAVGIGFGIYEAVKLFKEFVAVNVEAEYATAQLTAALKASGAASGQTIATLKAHASALQQLSTFDDEAVQRAQALLLTFDKIRGETFPGATQAVLDLATRMGGDLQGAALQVGKALQDPEHGLLALRRAGVSFSEAQQEIIKNLFATGHAAEGQALILKELTHEFGGSAAAARETLGGAIKGLENDFKDLLEQTSRTSGPVVGFLNAMAAGLRAVNEAVSDPSSIEGLKKRIAALQASISNSALDPRQHAQFIQPQIDVYKQQLATLEALEKAHAVTHAGSAAAIAAADKAAQEASDKAFEAKQKLNAERKKEEDRLKEARIKIDEHTAALLFEYDAEVRLFAALKNSQLAHDNVAIAIAGERAAIDAGKDATAAQIADRVAIAQATARLVIAEREYQEALKLTADRQNEAHKDLEAALAKIAKDVDETNKVIVKGVDEGFRKQAEAAKAAEELATRPFKNFVQAFQTDLAGAIENIFTKGIKSVGDFIGQMKALFVKLIAEIAAMRIMQGLTASMAGMFSGGLPALPKLNAQGIPTGELVGGGNKWAGGAAGVAIGAGTGYAIGAGTGSATAGVLGGAAAGAAAGGQLGGVYGAIAGGVIGAVAGLFGASAHAKAAAKQMAEAQATLALSIGALKASLSGDTLGVAIAQITAQFDALKKQAEAAYATGKNEAQRNVVLAELNALEAQALEAAKKKAEFEKQQYTESLAERNLVAAGDIAGAAAMGILIAQQGELEAAIQKFGKDSVQVSLLLLTQAAENAARARAQIQKDNEAAAALQVRVAAAMGGGEIAAALALQIAQEKEITDAITAGLSEATIAEIKYVQSLENEANAKAKLIAASRASEDLAVRDLIATGKQAEADALAFAEKQQREYEDAVAAGKDAEYLKLLKQTLADEAAQRAAAIAAQAGIPGASALAAGSSAASQTLTASMSGAATFTQVDRLVDAATTTWVILRHYLPLIEQNTRNWGGKVDTYLGNQLAIAQAGTGSGLVN